LATILSLTLRVYLHSFSRCRLPKSQNHVKFRQNLTLQLYSSSRSSKVIDLGVNGKTICDFLSVINCNFCRAVFEVFTLKDRKLLTLPTPPLFDTLLGENSLEFLDETYPAKSRGMGLPYGENFMILTSTVLYDPPI